MWITYELFYRKLQTKSDTAISIYITNETLWSDIDKLIREEYNIPFVFLYNRLIEYKKIHRNLKSGHYLLKKNQTINTLINSIRYGFETPVKITINNIRTLPELAGSVSSQVMFDSIEFINKLQNLDMQTKYEFNAATFITMFIPNTYEVYWTISVEDFLSRMFKEYNKFWNKERIKKADIINLTPVEITVLASIVEKETNIKRYMPVVAGVYVNRLKKQMLLQADPTVVFAVGNFDVRRITHKMLAFDSPYNTYKYTGLPPGPICLPSTNTVDAVLNYEKHQYLYFCASHKLDGSLLFAVNLNQHNQNAAMYHKALNKFKIYK